MSVTSTDTPDWMIQQLQMQFAQLGLGDLWSIVDGYIKGGMTDVNDIKYQLSFDPAAAKVIEARFPALRARQLKEPGFDIGHYLDLEDTYRNIVHTSGLPQGFYDQNSDYTKWIADGTSPVEVQARINTAANATMNADPNIKQALRDYYGVDDAGIMAHFLDPKTAADVLSTQYGAAQAGGAYRAQGLSLDKGLAEELALSQSNVANAAAGANQVAADLPNAMNLSNVWGEDLTSEDLTRDTFNLSGGAQARKKKNVLASQERAAFAGSSGVQGSSLSTAGTSGQI